MLTDSRTVVQVMNCECNCICYKCRCLYPFKELGGGVLESPCLSVQFLDFSMNFSQTVVLAILIYIRSIVKQVFHATYIDHSRHLITGGIHHCPREDTKESGGYRRIWAWLSLALNRAGEACAHFCAFLFVFHASMLCF